MIIKYILYVSLFVLGTTCGFAYHKGKPEMEVKEKDIKNIIKKLDMDSFRVERGHVIFYANQERSAIVTADKIYFTKTGDMRFVNSELVKFKPNGDVSFRVKSKSATMQGDWN